jgi:hypothetical protein
MTVIQQSGDSMNTDPLKSAQPCGCDEGANHKALDCKKHKMLNGRLVEAWVVTDRIPVLPESLERPAGMPIFPASAAGRKQFPMFTGLLAYFPDALAAVANVSFKGNHQHNPGEPLHWAREKSTDQKDTAIRHQMDHALVDPVDTDGGYHLAKAIWRLCAELQLTIEKERSK